MESMIMLNSLIALSVLVMVGRKLNALESLLIIRTEKYY
jgi:hypothetical protein